MILYRFPGQEKPCRELEGEKRKMDRIISCVTGGKVVKIMLVKRVKGIGGFFTNASVYWLVTHQFFHPGISFFSRIYNIIAYS